jgi:hypothetical protein
MTLLNEVKSWDKTGIQRRNQIVSVYESIPPKMSKKYFTPEYQERYTNSRLFFEITFHRVKLRRHDDVEQRPIPNKD